MASKKFELSAEPREDIGKGASRRLARQEKIPGIVYGGGKDAISLAMEHKHIAKALQSESFYSSILTLKTGNDTDRVILKDVQRHPYKSRILHVDFQRIRADQKLEMHIPLHFIGGDKAPGVKEGGIVSHIESDVEVSCLPDNLPEYLEVDISQLKLNGLMHLTDIPLPQGVELVDLLHDNNKAIVSIHMPRIEEEPVVAEPVSAEVPTIEQKSEAEIAAEQAKDKETKEKEKEKEKKK